MAKAISQSDTMWVKKGDKLPDGSVAKKGIVVQRSTGKRVTGSVKLVEATKRGKVGETVSLKAGRYAKSGSAKSGTAAGNTKGNTPPKNQNNVGRVGRAANALAKSSVTEATSSASAKAARARAVGQKAARANALAKSNVTEATRRRGERGGPGIGGLGNGAISINPFTGKPWGK